MKRLGMIVMAGLLLLGLAQCKKEQTPAGTGTEGVRITLNVGPSAGSGTNGSRVVVDPTGNNGEFDYATVNYENGDIIYVGYNGACVGSLTCQDNTFSGEVNITETVEGEHLHFYLLGGKGFTPQFDGNTATVNISEQATNYPVISYAPSKEAYNGAGSYTAKLMNKCSIVKFNVDTPSTAAICITGMNNKVTVNFANPTAEDNGFSYDMDDNGLITMPAKDENNVTWAIVIPQEALAAGEEGSAYTEGYTGTRPAMEAIEMNKFLADGIALTVNTPAVPAGAINGKFSVSPTKQVYFSKGNLQYIGSATTPYWKFADNQWEYLGTTTGQNSANQNVDRDLFGWGTSGYNHGATAYQPWATSTSYSEYNPYGATNTNLNSNSGQADWGYNAISNGGNQENSGWRTLTRDEWHYLTGSRPDKRGLGMVSDLKGLILLPDDWTLPDGLSFNPSIYGSNNSYTADEWNQMEANGAVFLPLAGTRNGTSLNNVGSEAGYWSSTCPPNARFAFYLLINNYDLNAQSTEQRHLGLCVRLVRNAE